MTTTCGHMLLRNGTFVFSVALQSVTFCVALQSVTRAYNSVGTTTIVVGSTYKIKGLGTVTLTQWTTAGWAGAALPVVDDVFVCVAAVPGTDGVCDTITAPAVGDVFTALAPTTAGATVFVDGTQSVGQKFKAIAVGPAGGPPPLTLIAATRGLDEAALALP